MTEPVILLAPSGNRSVTFGSSDRFAVIAGPCVVEQERILRTVAEKLASLQSRLPIDFVFKSSYRKANRTSPSSFTGIGDEPALRLLEIIRNEYDLPILTDIHSPSEARTAADVCDVLQIPAFLARQTELLVAAGETRCAVNIKKGQFMSPGDMQFALNKISRTGNKRALVSERGTFFGYGDLVVDFRSLVTMRSFGAPVIYDATHSVQRPSQNGASGGDRMMIEPLARAAMAVGIDGLFIETHPNPAEALSDKDSQLPLDQLESLLDSLLRIRESNIKEA